MIYLPMSVNILTPGHIKCLKHLWATDDVMVGLLTEKAMKGYKKELMPYTDRKFIVSHLSVPVVVVPQNELDPTKNIKKYKCDTIASGDGWEKEELDAIEKLKLKVINIKLPGEKSKRYSSSSVIKKI